jgi:hypothetical protein
VAAGKIGLNSDGKANTIDGKAQMDDGSGCNCCNPCAGTLCGSCGTPLPMTMTAVVSGVTPCAGAPDLNGSYTLTRLGDCSCTWCYTGSTFVVSLNASGFGSWFAEIAITDPGATCTAATVLSAWFRSASVSHAAFGCTGTAFANSNIDISDCGVGSGPPDGSGYGGTITISV